MITAQQYRRFWLGCVKRTATGMIVASAFGVACIFLDWFGHAGWGYPWYSLPFVLAFTAMGLAVRKLATFLLRQP